MIRRLLIANRAEIAARVIRTARARGTETVAVYSDADVHLPYVAMADAAVRLAGTAATDTYLRVDLLVEAALRSGADAVHPGYGFLSEHAGFARACEAAGLVFVGPSADVIERMGSKIEAKRIMAAAGVPVLEGVTIDAGIEESRLAALAAPIGYPLLVKASAGGGGRGMRVVETGDDLVDAVTSASREAAAAFGDGTVFLEHLVLRPRHVEVQVLGDAYGEVMHLCERECSIQRRHQKVVEESPSPGITDAQRSAICAAAVTAARAIGYTNAGTIEFVVDELGTFSFLEVNTRLQVEHPVTELVTGVDLVEAQLLVAEGHALSTAVPSVTSSGHAIEVRLYAEDPLGGYLPSSGTLSRFEVPAGDGVRVDAGYESGSVVTTSYDAMLAKVIAWAPTREMAARRLAGALRRATIHGVTTNRDLLVGVLCSDGFLAGATDTGFLERTTPGALIAVGRPTDGGPLATVAAALWQRARAVAGSPQPRGVPAGWRNVGPADQPRTYLVDGARHAVSVRDARAGLSVDLDGEAMEFRSVAVDAVGVSIEVGGRLRRYAVEASGHTVYVDGPDGGYVLVFEPRLRAPEADEAPGSMHAPLPGAVRRVAVASGDAVAAGDVLMVLEAMKMEHAIRAPHDGTVVEVHVADGDQVDRGDVLAVVQAEEDVEP